MMRKENQPPVHLHSAAGTMMMIIFVSYQDPWRDDKIQGVQIKSEKKPVETTQVDSLSLLILD